MNFAYNDVRVGGSGSLFELNNDAELLMLLLLSQISIALQVILDTL